ncbi:MAG: thiamine biosynthesis protein ThiF [Planctomycetaceae bacterium]|nr:MAG: thiamine biosynthesis protein ThiF [Planctomycetaceae bacterium]
MQPLDSERYSRQIRFQPLGSAGQTRLAMGRVVVVGCGALGSVVAMALVRAGVGHLRIIDRDVPELSNLPRQVLFDEADVAAGIPKAAAAKQHLQRINAAASVEAIVADLSATTAENLLMGADVIVDGTDNFEARFIINDFSCRDRVPWIYGGAIGAEGRVLTVLPGQTACLRCLIPEPPAAGVMPTCETAGIIGPAALVVGAVESAEAIKVLSGITAGLGNRLFICDLWAGVWRTIDLSALAAEGCPTCRGNDFPWLEGRISGQTAVICGRAAVQVSPARNEAIDLIGLALRLKTIGIVTANPWLVRVEVEPGIQLSVFADGRAIVSGTREEAKARAIIARYLGA